MNEQNNFNNSYDNQQPNLSNPTQGEPRKKRTFFSSSLFGKKQDEEYESLGEVASTVGAAQIVGEAPEALFDSDEMVQGVNSYTVGNNNTEVLDDYSSGGYESLDSYPENYNQYPDQVQTGVYQQQQAPVQAPQPNGGLAVYAPQPEQPYPQQQMMQQQPMMSQQPMMPQQPAATVESSTIFQSLHEEETMETPEVTPQTVEQAKQQDPGQPWMADQPLSEGNVQGSTATNNNVVSANKREEEEKRKKEEANKPKDTKAVPDDVLDDKTKKDVKPDQLVGELVGMKYTNFVMSPFNFAALLFGPLYIAYRRMTFFALVVLAGELAIIFYAPLKYVIIGLLAYHIFLALIVNRIYVLYSKGVVKGIVKRNKKKNQEELAVICHQKGRPYIVYFIMFAMLFAASVVAISFYLLPDSEVGKIIKNSVDLGSISKNAKYEGTIEYDYSYAVENVIKVKIPDGFNRDDSGGIAYTFESTDEGEANTCSFKIAAIKGFSDGDDFIRQMALYDDKANLVDTVDTNNIHWTNYYTVDGNYNVYYKGMTYKNKAILFVYRSGNDVSMGACDRYFVEIMQTLKIKGE